MPACSGVHFTTPVPWRSRYSRENTMPVRVEIVAVPVSAFLSRNGIRTCSPTVALDRLRRASRTVGGRSSTCNTVLSAIARPVLSHHPHAYDGLPGDGGCPRHGCASGNVLQGLAVPACGRGDGHRRLARVLDAEGELDRSPDSGRVTRCEHLDQRGFVQGLTQGALDVRTETGLTVEVRGHAEQSGGTRSSRPLVQALDLRHALGQEQQVRPSEQDSVE